MRRTATIVLVVLLGTLAQAGCQGSSFRISPWIQRDTLRYPYGCVEDKTVRPLLRCTTSNFSRAHFDSLADFRQAQFDSRADFRQAQFESISLTPPDYLTQLGRQADFSRAHFDSLADFSRAQFESLAFFYKAHFESRANFRQARFDSWAMFSEAHFDSLADFSRAQFESLADFQSVQADTIVFHQALIAGTLLLGTNESQTYPVFVDLTTVFLRPTTQIELHNPVHITIQREKITHLTLASDLLWDAKKRIIDDLKARSFKDDDAAHFQLDYLFERSTMFQGYTEHWYDPVVYVFRAAYWATMGLGYRPFWIFGWAGLMILIFAAYYRRKIPLRIYDFIQETKPALKTQAPPRPRQEVPEPTSPRALTPWIHCLYFSTMVFFTFRLKQKILTFFDAREQRLIVFQWSLGFLVYLAFLTLSKSGSILQQLKTLFIG